MCFKLPYLTKSSDKDKEEKEEKDNEEKKDDKEKKDNEEKKEDEEKKDEKEGDAKEDSGQVDVDEDFVQEALEAHNELRAKHGAPPLTVNKDLCQIAQKWSNKLAAEDKFEHSSPQKFTLDGAEHYIGENLACGSADLSGKEATQMWYDEIKDYDFANPGFGMSTGHFTQVVWKGTTAFGIGRAKGSKGNTVVTGSYCPGGNAMNGFEDNVLPASG